MLRLLDPPLIRPWEWKRTKHLQLHLHCYGQRHQCPPNLIDKTLRLRNLSLSNEDSEGVTVAWEEDEVGQAPWFELAKILASSCLLCCIYYPRAKGQPKWTTFRLFQRSHTMITKSSALNSSLQDKKSASNSLNEVGCGGAVWRSHSNVDQAPVMASQYHTAWREYSGKLWHCAQLGLGTMLRRWRLTNVSSELLSEKTIFF